MALPCPALREAAGEGVRVSALDIPVLRAVRVSGSVGTGDPGSNGDNGIVGPNLWAVWPRLGLVMGQERGWVG